MNDHTLPAIFTSALVVTISAGLIVSGYRPRGDDLWLLLTYAAGVVSALVGLAIWRLR